MKTKAIISFALVVALLLGCSRDNRASSFKVGLSGNTQNFDGSENKWKALLEGTKESGVSLLHLQTPPWSEAETSLGTFNFSYFDSFFKLQDEYKISYTLDIATPLGLGRIDHPSDISFTSFNDPELVERYSSYVREVLTRFPDASHVILHTETAGPYFSNDASREDFIAYCDLISLTADYVRSIRRNIRVGIYGTTQESKEILDCLNRSTDFFGLSYIADRADNDHVAQLQRLIDLAGDRQLAFFEIGIPTNPLLGGSEETQVEFVDLVFDLAEHYGHRLEFLSYYQFIDEDESITRTYVPQLFPNFSRQEQEELIAFLSSLGLLGVNGEPKLAWSTFMHRVANKSE